jgi:ribosomal protein S8
MRKEGKPHGNKTPPQTTMHKIKNANKRQFLSNHVLHSKKTSQLCKFVLFDDFVEDVDVYTDLMKYMHN